MFCLICISGLAVGEEISLRNKIMTLGRNDDNDICILDSEVSRHHCRITQDNRVMTVEDLDSRNGLFVNEIFYSESCGLKEKDFLRLGNTTYLVYDDANPPAYYKDVKKILAQSNKEPKEIIVNIMALQMSQTVTCSKDNIPKRG